MEEKLEPKLFTILFRDGYRKKEFFSDLMSGIVVGFVAFPLALAFAIASGVTPEQGLFTAIIAGLVIAVFGGSRVQVSGPTGAFIVVIYSIVQEHGYSGLAIATMIAGFLLIGMGLLRMGTFIRFIPFPVTIGFTSGIAVIIFSSQIKDLLGLKIEELPADFIDKWHKILTSLESADLWSILCSLGTLLLLILWPRVTKRIPASIIAIVLVTFTVHILKIPVETIADRFGVLSPSFPSPEIPYLSWSLCVKLFQPAITIALLGAIESLLSAVVADGMMGGRHRSNMELIAQGIGNILSPIFQGIPATGAIARTATNVKNGGRTPVAAVVHAITLFVLVTTLAEYAGYVPLAVIAAILVHVAYSMSEWKLFAHMFSFPRSDVVVMIITFLLTVLIDLAVAIEIGMVLAAFLFMKRMESVSEVSALNKELLNEYDETQDAHSLEHRQIPPQTRVFEVFGPLFFGAVSRFNTTMSRIAVEPGCFILRMRNVPALDASGLFAIEQLVARFESTGTQLILSGIRPQPLSALKKAGLISRIGTDNICTDINDALNRSHHLIMKHDG